MPDLLIPVIATTDILGQQFEPQDAALIGLLVLLEGVLSLDNALVLGLLARRLPKTLQGRALTYGLVGAFAFRIIAISTASFLLRWRIVKLIGGGYLVYVAVKHLFFESKETSDAKTTLDAQGKPTLIDPQTGQPISSEQAGVEIDGRVPVDLAEPSPGKKARFWPTVIVIELTDIAFAVDSILAAIALVGSPPAETPPNAPHPKLWVVIAGGMLGVILMRFAAVVFIKLLENFPRFESAAYLLVIVIGGKLLADWGFNSEHVERLDFHSPSALSFWVFWSLMIISFLTGFIPQRTKPK